MLRPEFVERKLQLITDELGRLLEFRDVGYEELVADPVRLAAVERMLERIILRAIDVRHYAVLRAPAPMAARAFLSPPHPHKV